MRERSVSSRPANVDNLRESEVCPERSGKDFMIGSQRQGSTGT